LPTNLQDVTLSARKPLRQAEIDYRRLRCTVGMVNRTEGLLMACPGSTVPHLKAVKAALARYGAGANRLVPGLLRFAKGAHPAAGGDGSHFAFTQAQPFPHSRTLEDLDFDDDDVIVTGFPGDNLHSAYVDSVGSDFPANFESAGCIVVAGFPKRIGRPATRDLGCWPRFRDAAYASGQMQFAFLLSTGPEAEAVATAEVGTVPCALRFGSEGPLVERMQQALVLQGLLEPTEVNGRFRARTLSAVTAFQRREQLSVDGTFALHSADALGIEDWPRV